MAAKLTKLAKPNQIAISHGTYPGMPSSMRKRFAELEIAPKVWKHIDKKLNREFGHLLLKHRLTKFCLVYFQFNSNDV
ncbi:MAG: hypothetical protein M3162_07010 [Thermoproteota archaeon]|nr:hypothetical protein [Thermoproteota archaeon]